MASKMRHILPHRVSHLHRNGGTGSAKNSRASSPARGPAPLAHDAKPLILKVYVIRGRDLAAKDKSGTSDPYLVVSLGTARQSTPSISKNLNPEWKVCFDMPLTGVPLLECVCWDKDRFGKDYMGEFDIAVEDIFSRGGIQAEPKWYKLKSKRRSKGHGGHKHDVSGEVQLQFSLIDSANPAASPEDIRRKFRAQLMADEEEDDASSLSRFASNQSLDDDLDDDDDADSLAEVETDSMSDANSGADKKKKKRKLRMLRRKSIAVRAYEFSGRDSDISGMVFMELLKVTDLPPERNMTRTTFDCDPFVVTALGRKVLRTKVVRHNLNPVYNEKMVFQVLKHELGYSLTFSIMDRDKLSGNDFIASAAFSLQRLTDSAPEPDPQTGLYLLPEPQEYSPPLPQSRSKFRLPISRSPSSQGLNKLDRPEPLRSDSQSSVNGGRPMLDQRDSQSSSDGNGASVAPTSAPTSAARPIPTSAPSTTSSLFRYDSEDRPPAPQDPSMQMYTVPLELQNQARWEDKHSPKLYLQARYLPYRALRQQFWRAMLKQYDTDDSRRISKIELTTMLDTLGSTLRESTINGFFQRWAGENERVDEVDLTYDQAIICLEEQLMKTTMKPSITSKVKTVMHMASSVPNGETSVANPPRPETSTSAPSNEDPTRSAVPALSVMDHGASGEEGELIHPDDLAEDSSGEEHVIEIRECPICHQPKLNKRADADIITHIATCASEDWRSVNTLVMGGFVTQSQAQRKWYSKVINKVSYGGYKLGANSANILVQDRITGQINEERMSVYVRLGIRLLYKALGSREMEKKRIKKMLKSLSVKQGKKYDDPASISQIEPFINFHRLDMSEVRLPTSDFRNFNEFFYRALKPEARPCSAPDRPEIIVSPADCRTVVFNTIDEATKIWVKGRDFTLKKLLGDAYPLDAKRYVGGSMGIFRLAPQDYHRFHIPVDGTLGTPKVIDGEYYTVNPMAIRSALDVYGENIRVVVPIDSVAHGRVMYVCIGAMMVGSTIITRKAGEKVKRAEELGYFKFGGSTILLFFEPGRMVYDDDLVDNSNGALETLVRVGMSLGHSPHVEPHRPDMKKNENEVTNEERQAAKRRIEGSLAPDAAKRAGLDTGLHIQ